MKLHKKTMKKLSNVEVKKVSGGTSHGIIPPDTLNNTLQIE
ncbi:hypothetical protein [Pseudoalteromonas luteoviolacea]|uniref:Uncharacterized protein n=1 Tax=Pseudoalteromonas luteoviolacea S4060-1 TaxID=1365257 RepID=A0A167KH29_9GAMM|nr:hypothetical protein [Pseudoalteromonas luteoviolacea]KZN62782.1 hypothetical protein N478_25180 [Pseudoalteromonas luteoviolacea S4060-1]